MTDRSDRAARRAFVRAAHPDAGGDPAEFVAGLAAFDRRTAPDPRYDAPVVGAARSTRLRRIARRLRGLLVRRPPRVQ